MSSDQQKKSGAQMIMLQALLATIRASTSLLRWVFPVLILFYLLSGVAIVRPNETGLRYRFGKLLEGTYPPGLVWALPAPFEKLVKVSTAEEREIVLSSWKDAEIKSEHRTKAQTVPLHPVEDGYTLTGDANLLRGDFVMRYRVANPVFWHRTAEPRESLLASTVYGAAAEVFCQKAIDDVMKDREPVRKKIQALAQERLDRLGTGVQLSGLELRELGPPGQVRAAFEEVTTAQLSAQTALEEARAYRADQLPQIEAESQVIRQQAETAGREKVANAKGESAAFLAMLSEYQASRELVRARLYDETLQQILPRVRSRTLLPRNPEQQRTTTILIEPAISPENIDE